MGILGVNRVSNASRQRSRFFRFEADILEFIDEFCDPSSQSVFLVVCKTDYPNVVVWLRRKDMD